VELNSVIFIHSFFTLVRIIHNFMIHNTIIFNNTIHKCSIALQLILVGHYIRIFFISFFLHLTHCNIFDLILNYNHFNFIDYLWNLLSCIFRVYLTPKLVSLSLLRIGFVIFSSELLFILIFHVIILHFILITLKLFYLCVLQSYSISSFMHILRKSRVK